METLVADIPTSPKAFDLWVDARWTHWPHDLIGLAERAYQALLMSERDPGAWRHSPGTRRLNSADWSAFTTAYAEHVGAKS